MTRVELPPETTRRFGCPIAFEPLDLGAGPRPIPAWSNGAHIRWRWAYDNRPDFMLRCRYDPLAFATDGSPVWRPFKATNHAMKPTTGWIAEQDGVASIHYHDGAISLRTFEEPAKDQDGKVIWIERPGPGNGFVGKHETNSYQMLSTVKNEGYGGRWFDITLAECEIVIDRVPTIVPAGTRLRLWGPWHGGSPAGFSEVSYWIDKDLDAWERRHRRKWYDRGGYFGLYVRSSVLPDIFATHLPHVEWAITEDEKGRNSIEPLVRETRLPKNWPLDPADCPGHNFTHSPYSNRGDHPSDRCKYCRDQRDPAWRYRSEYEIERERRERAERAARAPLTPGQLEIVEGLLSGHMVATGQPLALAPGIINALALRGVDFPEHR